MFLKSSTILSGECYIRHNTNYNNDYVNDCDTIIVGKFENIAGEKQIISP